MRRREFITLLGGIAVRWRVAARAQQRLPAVGFLSGLSSAGSQVTLAALRQGLSDTGFVEHRNFDIEYRWAEGHYERLPAMAADLARRRDLREAVKALGLRLHLIEVGGEGDLATAFPPLTSARADALFVTADGFLHWQLRDPMIALAARHRLPAMYVYRDCVEAGGLISYTSSLVDAGRQAGVYAGRIFKGAKPGDLPVTQPTKFELVIDLKTARVLGLNVPGGLLAIADEVID